MSDPGRPPTAALVDALDVARHAKVGFATGVLVAVTAYLYRVLGLLGPVRDPRVSPLLFLLLAFVLATSVGTLVTLLLVGRTAIGKAREGS